MGLSSVLSVLTVPRRLGLLAAALLALGALVTLSLAGLPSPRAPLSIPVPLLLLVMLVAELGRMHLEVRRSALTVTLADVAVVVAVFSVAPDDVVLLRTLACAPVLLWLYRRSRIRLAVNLGVLLLETAAVAGLVHLLTATPDPSRSSPGAPSWSPCRPADCWDPWPSIWPSGLRGRTWPALRSPRACSSGQACQR